MRISSVLLVTLLCPLVLLGQDEEDVEKLKASIVKITSKAADGQPQTGTGFIVRVDREIISIATASHVVQGDEKPMVTFYHDKLRPVAAEIGTLEEATPTTGLGYLIVRDRALAQTVEALNWSTETLRGGEKVTIIGFGQASGPWGVVDGTVASTSGTDIRIGGGIGAGNSGGPIIRNGGVAGMVVAAFPQQGFGDGKLGSVVQLTLRGWGVEISTPPTARAPSREPSKPPTDTTTQPKNILSFRDWEGSWDLQWEFDGQWYGKTMRLTADSAGIVGDYVLGTLKGRFLGGDFSKATGTVTNVTGTGKTCSSGGQTGSFSLDLADDAGSMAGWWDVCSEGQKYRWKADRRNAP